MWPLLRSFLFHIDPEKAHRLVISLLETWSHVCSVTFSKHDIARDPKLERKFFGVTFPNPIGLAAGFDKDAEAVVALQRFGFGFIEVGTVTAKPQEGNPKPRLFRLPQDEALFNRLGFNNQGAVALAKRLEAYRARDRLVVPIGVNIGKSKVVPNESAAADYLESFQTVADVADYIVVNVSSPNTPGLRNLQQSATLSPLLGAIADENEKRRKPLPLLLKLSPDLADEDAIAAGEVAQQHGFKGLIVSNTTISREGLVSPFPEGAGGISGRPLFLRSTEMLKKLRVHFRDHMVFIGVGGILGPQNAREKFISGADLIQLYTGFIYAGPKLPRRILKGVFEMNF